MQCSAYCNSHWGKKCNCDAYNNGKRKRRPRVYKSVAPIPVDQVLSGEIVVRTSRHGHTTAHVGKRS